MNNILVLVLKKEVAAIRAYTDSMQIIHESNKPNCHNMLLASLPPWLAPLPPRRLF